MNMSIDNRYCNRFIHIGRPIFSVNCSCASVYNPDDIWERACAVLHSRGTAHPICDPSRIIATRQLNALTVPWSHNVSNSCNCNRFNHCERPIFCLSIGHQPGATSDNPAAISSCCDQVVAQWLQHSTCSRKHVAWKYSLKFICTFRRNISLPLQYLRPVAIFQ